MSPTFVVSDLARQRREVVNAARLAPTRIRDTDGVMLVLTTENLEAARDEIIRLYSLYARAVIECRHDRPSATALDEVGYIVDWSPDRRSWFLDGLAEALTESRNANSPDPALFFIRYCAPFAGPVPVPVAIDRGFAARFGAAIREHVGE
jgi:hypothetical protein